MKKGEEKFRERTTKMGHLYFFEAPPGQRARQHQEVE